MTEARRRRARETEHAVARYLRNNGWPYAEAVGSGRSGVDVTGVPGISLEVKARASFNPLAWMKQARDRPGVPIVVLRCNGQGENVDRYAALLPFDYVVQLLRAAGYGSPTAPDGQDEGLADWERELLEQEYPRYRGTAHEGGTANG